MIQTQRVGVSKRLATGFRLRKAVSEERAGEHGATRRRVQSSVRVEKTDAERGIIWGWGSVAELVDLQGDVIPQAELEDAVYRFMENYYVGRAAVGDNHEEVAEAVIVESCLEWRGGALRWWLGVKLLSEDLREEARAGKISGFSIGGYAEEAEEEEGAPDGEAA